MNGCVLISVLFAIDDQIGHGNKQYRYDSKNKHLVRKNRNGGYHKGNKRYPSARNPCFFWYEQYTPDHLDRPKHSSGRLVETDGRKQFNIRLLLQELEYPGGQA